MKVIMLDHLFILLYSFQEEWGKWKINKDVKNQKPFTSKLQAKLINTSACLFYLNYFYFFSQMKESENI